MSSRKVLVALAGVFLLTLISCGPSEEEVKAAALAEEWAALQVKQSDLMELRGEAAEALVSERQGLESQVNDAADAFAERLVTFINEYAGFEGEEPLPEVKAAIGLKSIEDIELAREYVAKGGDYAKAIDILRGALIADPGNAALEAELRAAEGLRFMSEERFSAVEKGMTEDEVRALLGQVKPQNVRDYKEQNAVAWFFPKEGGAAAAVFFREKDGQLKVDSLQFDAVATASDRAAEG